MNGAKNTNWAEIVRQVAGSNPEIAGYRDIAELVLDRIRGGEADLLGRLLPGYVRAVLSRGVGGSADDEWESFLDERLATSQRGTIFMRDANAEEVDEAAERRFRFAGNLDGRGKKFQAVAKALRENSVVNVGGLSPIVGGKTLRDLEVSFFQARARRMNATAKAAHIKPLRELRDGMRDDLRSGEVSESIVALRRRRDDLIDQLDVLIWQERERLIIREVLEEMHYG